jgi:tetratricopeptide (TPR) repeat protein
MAIVMFGSEHRSQMAPGNETQMMPGSMLRTHEADTSPQEKRSRGARIAGLLRGIAIPVALVSVVAVAAACSSNSNSPRASANASVSQGLRAESSGQPQQAINDFKAAVADDPTDPIPYYDLGVMNQQYLKDPTQAATYYNRAILADPSYRPALYNLAILESPSNPQGAISLYNELLKINPNDSNVLFNVGLLLINQGQKTQGQSDVYKAVAINPALKSRVPPGVTS